jgi:hypothetical protein
MEFDCLGLCLHEQWAGYVLYKAGGDRDVGDVRHPDLIRAVDPSVAKIGPSCSPNHSGIISSTGVFTPPGRDDALSRVMDASAQTRRSAESRDPPDKVPAIARGVGKNFEDMRPPPFKRVFALCQKIVALIHGSDTGDCPGLVVENLVSHVRRDT